MTYNPKDWKMPYGKYEGKTFDELPINYIKWVANNKKHGMRKYALLEWKRRIQTSRRIKVAKNI